MKKRVLLGTALLSMLLLGACSKDEVAPAATQLYPSPVVKMGLNIHVTASSTAARTAGLSGASVIVKQNGKSYTATTDASGIATFADLVEGQVNCFISQSGYASSNTSFYISYNGSLNVNGTNGNSTSGNSVSLNNTQTTTESKAVSLAKLGSSVSGVIMADLDGSGAGVVAVLNTGTIVLSLDDTSLQPNVYKTTISNGVYTFANLPEGVNYTLTTENINATIPAFGATPTYQDNLNFPGNVDNGTTPKVGQIEQRGPVTLQ